MAKWMGSPPEKCDICGGEIRVGFIDGKTTMGPWAMMCPRCFKKYGVGLGLGRGQAYDRQADGEYVKFAG